MITIEEVLKRVKDTDSKKMVVVCPYDSGTIEASVLAKKEGICNPIFIGESSKISQKITIDELISLGIEHIDVEDDSEAAKVAMNLLKEKKADVLMKGLIDTSLLLKTLLSKEYELRGSGLLSHVGLLSKKDHKSYLITDAAINIVPTLEQKVQIINNAVKVAHSLGIEEPVVANICAKEKPYDKMPATLDAAKLQEMYLNGEFEGCVISGPLQMDNAVSLEACEIKGVKDKAGGRADILMCNVIEVGNAVSKALTYIAGYSFSGIVVGAKVPMVLTSRADSCEEKLQSIAIACCM